MKFLVLYIGFVCCIIDLFLRNDVKYKMKNNNLLAIGVLLIVVNSTYLLLGLLQAIFVVIIVVLTIIYKGSLDFWDKEFWDVDFSDRQEAEWVFGSILIIVAILLITFQERNLLLNVKLKDDVIKVRGGYGRSFIVSNIQSVDTVSVIPKVVRRHKGEYYPKGNFIGDFTLANESKTALLSIFTDNPPYIIVRMNDNRLLMFNFKKPDKTVEFYNQLKEKL